MERKLSVLGYFELDVAKQLHLDQRSGTDSIVEDAAAVPRRYCHFTDFTAGVVIKVTDIYFADKHQYTFVDVSVAEFFSKVFHADIRLKVRCVRSIQYRPGYTELFAVFGIEHLRVYMKELGEPV